MPKITSSTLLQFSSYCRKRRVVLKRCYVGRFGRTNFRFKGQLATTSSNRVGDWRVLFNLLEARLSIVSQIYTSVLKTKVKLIEYAFETLPAWALSMPPSKARKYIQTINNVGGVPQLTKNTLTKNALLLFLNLTRCSAFLVFKKVRHREFWKLWYSINQCLLK